MTKRPAPNPKAVGELSEAIVIAELLRRGLSVSLPFGNNQRYDLIVDLDGHLLRAQVKTAQLRAGIVKVPTASKNGFTGVRSDYRGEADIFLAYCPGLEKVYWIPVEICGLTNVSLRVDKPKGGPTSTLRWARDFELNPA